MAAEAEKTFGQVAFLPKTVAAYTEVSRLLLLQSNADFVIARDLLRIIGTAIDKAALYGTGLNGQPIGLASLAGVGAFSGATASVSTFTTAFVGLGDALGNRGGVAANRSTAGLLRTRPESTYSSRTLWDGELTDGTVINYPARSSTAIPSGNAIVGSWEYLVIAVWGGIELMVNPYGDRVTGTANFQKGVVGYRVMATVDTGVVYPSAFTVGTGVT